MSVYYDDDPFEGDGVYDLGEFEMEDFATPDEILEDLDDLGIEGEDVTEDGYTDLDFYAAENSTNYGNQVPDWYDDDEFDFDDDDVDEDDDEWFE